MSLNYEKHIQWPALLNPDTSFKLFSIIICIRIKLDEGVQYDVKWSSFPIYSGVPL